MSTIVESSLVLGYFVVAGAVAQLARRHLIRSLQGPASSYRPDHLLDGDATYWAVDHDTGTNWLWDDEEGDWVALDAPDEPDPWSYLDDGYDFVPEHPCTASGGCAGHLFEDEGCPF